MERVKKVEIKNVSKTFYDKSGYSKAVDGVSLDIYDGEFLVLLGPGHCGKTVLLNMLAGLLDKSEGSILYNGEEVVGTNSDFAMIFQKLALLPFRTVMENVELGLKFAGENKEKRRTTSQYYIDMVGLGGFENSYPRELSGGMKQRVGIARAYSMNPSLLIMDEPFGQLDAQTRYSMQNKLLEICKKEKRTILFVTNNLEEACYLGDRIILLSSVPAKVKATYEVDLPHPRDMISKEFLDLRLEISDNTDLSI